MDLEGSFLLNGLLDEFCLQVLDQRAAMEREGEELEAHWSTMRADHLAKEEAVQSSAAKCRAAQEDLVLVEQLVFAAACELEAVQREATKQLVMRKRMQQELAVCADIFGSEAAAQRQAGSELQEERSRLRDEAVRLGQELQRRVLEADEFACETLHQRSEAAALDDACAALLATPLLASLAASLASPLAHACGAAEGGDEGIASSVREVSALCAELAAAHAAASSSSIGCVASEERGVYDVCEGEEEDEEQRLQELLEIRGGQILALQRAVEQLSGIESSAN